MMTYIV